MICWPTGPTLFQRTRGSTWASPVAYVPLPTNPLSQPAEETTRLGLCICREEAFAFLSSHFIVFLLQRQIGHCPLRHWFLTNVTRGFGGPLCKDSVALRCPLGCIRQRGTMAERWVVYSSLVAMISKTKRELCHSMSGAPRKFHNL